MVPDNKGCDQFVKLARVHSGDYVPIVTANVGIYGLKLFEALLTIHTTTSAKTVQGDKNWLPQTIIMILKI